MSCAKDSRSKGLSVRGMMVAGISSAAALAVNHTWIAGTGAWRAWQTSSHWVAVGATGYPDDSSDNATIAAKSASVQIEVQADGATVIVRKNPNGPPYHKFRRDDDCGC